jgi:hypothetical protein
MSTLVQVRESKEFVADYKRLGTRQDFWPATQTEHWLESRTEAIERRVSHVYRVLFSLNAKYNDPGTPQAWLPNRTEPFSISDHRITAISDLARFSTVR